MTLVRVHLGEGTKVKEMDLISSTYCHHAHLRGD